MTLRDYCSLISGSVAETGYDSFRPSACVYSAESVQMHVLEVELKDEGDASAALTWGASLLKEGAVLYLAYRSGNRTVTVSAVRENKVVEKIVVRVRPSTEE